MRELSAQLVEAEGVAVETEQAALASRGEDVRNASPRPMGMLSDTHGRHHNYLRISLTERYGHGGSRRLAMLQNMLRKHQASVLWFCTGHE